MTRKSGPTDRQKLGMVEHIAFDMGQLARQHALVPNGTARSAAETASLYSFLLHARNLLGFYFPPPPKDQRDGDVFAADYVEGFEVEGAPDDERISAVRKGISTRVAHICVLRMEKVSWPISDYFTVLTSARDSFLKQLPLAYRSEFLRYGVHHRTW